MVPARFPRLGAYGTVSTSQPPIPTGTAGAPDLLKGGAGFFSREPRSDAFPEFTTYLDVGCTVHPTCLSCHLVSCIYDDPGGYRSHLTRLRQRFVHYARTRGVPWPVIARWLHLSVRHVMRLAQEARHRHGAPQQARLGSLVPLPSTTRRQESTPA